MGAPRNYTQFGVKLLIMESPGPESRSYALDAPHAEMSKYVGHRCNKKCVWGLMLLNKNPTTTWLKII